MGVVVNRKIGHITSELLSEISLDRILRGVKITVERKIVSFFFAEQYIACKNQRSARVINSLCAKKFHFISKYLFLLFLPDIQYLII